MEALGRQAQTSSVFLSYYEIIFPKCNFILHILKTSHYLDSSSLGCEHFQMFGCTKTVSSYKFPFLPSPVYDLRTYKYTSEIFSCLLLLYSTSTLKGTFPAVFTLFLSSLSAQSSSLLWHSSQILCDVPYISFLEPVCNKSFIFIFFYECSFHYHVGIILKDPTRVTCPFTI